MINEGMGKRIEDLRKERNITREQLADKVGITVKFLYEVENDKKGVSAEILSKIATVLSASCDYILTGEGKKQNVSFINLGQRKLKQLEGIAKSILVFCEER